MAGGRIIVPPYFPVRDGNGYPVSGAELYVYQNQTTTLASIYSDLALTLPAPNPIQANVSGVFPAVFAEAGTEGAPVLYSVAITDSAGRAPGRPSVFDNYRPSVDYETAALFLAEQAAGNAEANAAIAAQAVLDIIALEAGDVTPITNRALRDGSNITDPTTFRANIGAVSKTGADASASFVQNLIYQRVATGAQPRSVFDKLSDWVSVKEFGAIDDGVTDNSAAIQLAISSLPGGGGVLFFPCRLGLGYGVTDVTIDRPVRFEMGGGYYNGTKFIALSPTGDIFKVVSFGVRIDNFCVSPKAGVVRTSGAYLKCTVPYLQIFGGQIEGHYIAFELDGATLSMLAAINFRSPTRHSTAAGGAHIVIGRNTVTTALTLHSLTSDTDYSTGPLQPDGQPTSGIRVFNSDALIISDCDIVRSGWALHRTPGNGQAVTASYIHHSYFDNSRGGIRDEPTGTGRVFRNFHDTVWASSSTNAGISANGPSGAVFGNVYHQPQAHLNGTDGYSDPSGSTDQRVIGMAAGGNIGAGASVSGARTSIRTGKMGTYDGLTANQYGVFVSASATDYDIVDNALEGNTTPISDAALHAGRNVRGNRGYKTKSTGVATMASGATTVTVAHGLPQLVPLSQITVTAPLNIGSATRLGVQNSVAGTFDISFNTAPGSAISLPWSATLETM